QPDPVHETSHCGTCRACLEACPTDAFVGPNLLDATQCISYLTIELKEPIPVSLRKPMGDWVFGCDVCQDVCPWNRKSPMTAEPAFQPRPDLYPLDLMALFDLTDDEFRSQFRKTPLWRPRRRGILRNAAIVLGNQQHPQAIPSLIKGLNDEEPLIRGACSWALHQFAVPQARAAIAERLLIERDAVVISELKRSPR
ncbi:MAG: 4Fe-4S double cluster binding domain-containing protein, partial [Verrucomicrobiota bacterium]|nr:4Fe-4S double cluster binding domain-containing protein [Verrucomicrobiota bacterium]